MSIPISRAVLGIGLTFCLAAATAMAAGSILGAILGGLAVAYAPLAWLKVLLGCALLAAAGKTIFHKPS